MDEDDEWAKAELRHMAQSEGLFNDEQEAARWALAALDRAAALEAGLRELVERWDDDCRGFRKLAEDAENEGQRWNAIGLYSCGERYAHEARALLAEHGGES